MYVSLIFSVWMRCREGRIHSGDPRGPRALDLGSGRAALGPPLSPGTLRCAAGLRSAASGAAGTAAPRLAAAPRKEPQALHLPPAPGSPLRALGWPAPSPGSEPSARRCRSCSRSRYRTSASRADSSSKRTRDGEGPRGRRGRPQLDSPLDESLRLPPSRGATLSLPLGSLAWGGTDRWTRTGQEGENPAPKVGRAAPPPRCPPAGLPGARMRGASAQEHRTASQQLPKPAGKLSPPRRRHRTPPNAPETPPKRDAAKTPRTPGQGDAAASETPAPNRPDPTAKPHAPPEAPRRRQGGKEALALTWGAGRRRWRRGGGCRGWRAGGWREPSCGRAAAAAWPARAAGSARAPAPAPARGQRPCGPAAGSGIRKK